MCAGRAQHLPRLGLCGLRQQGDRSLVQARGAVQLGQLPEGLGLRVDDEHGDDAHVNWWILNINYCL